MAYPAFPPILGHWFVRTPSTHLLIGSTRAYSLDYQHVEVKKLNHVGSYIYIYIYIHVTYTHDLTQKKKKTYTHDTSLQILNHKNTNRPIYNKNKKWN